VDPNGRVAYVSEGQLRASLRKAGPGGLPTFKRADAAPLESGKATTLTFEILPTSVLIRRGHRLRVAIAGADKDTFAPIPENETPTVVVHRARTQASFVELPVIVRPRTPE
jgi:uncharacterized protein